MQGGGGGAYGGSMAGRSFDPVDFVRRPATILRALTAFFSMIVFGCVSTGSYYLNANGKGDSECMFNASGSACGWAVFAGVLSFLACVAFLIADGMFDNISAVDRRKQIVLADLAVAGASTVVFFLTFCVLVSKWGSWDGKGKVYDGSPTRAALAFMFFAMLSWAGLAFFAYRRYIEGAANAFAPTFSPDFAGPTGLPANYPSVHGSAYQDPPFSANGSQVPGNQQQYQPPSY